MSVRARTIIYLLMLIFCLGCGRQNNASGTIPIVVSNGRFGERDTAVAATVSPSPTDANAPPAGDRAQQASPPTPLSADVTASPTRTLTETLEDLVGTPVVDATASTTETVLDDGGVGALQVSVLGVRVAPLNVSLIDPGDNRALVVRARFQNPTNSAIFLQVGSDSTLRDAAGTQYAPSFIARSSAQAREPDALVTPGGSVEGEIAYVVPNTATTFEWIVRSGSEQSRFMLPEVPVGSPEAESSASALPAETTTAEPGMGIRE